MPLKLGPAGVPLSCKGRTIVEGMDDITVLGLDAMEVQTVRTIQPQHFDQYWQAGILSWKSDFEMNMHGPYYAELLGSKRERNRTLSKMETSLQAGKIINARHLTFHVGPYGEYEPGTEANEQVANVMAGVVERVREVWGDEEEEEDYYAFPWVHESEPSLVGVETSGRQELWGTVEEVLEVCNHVEGTVPVLNMGHIHARGHGRLRTSEDYAELFDQARETYGGSTFYCHFAGVEHRMGNALHYTQIKKSDLKFEPFAEYLAEEGDWMDITIISDSPLLEHDAMYMLQHYDKARQRLLEIKARDERRAKLAAQQGIDPEELKRKEEEAAAARKAQLTGEVEEKPKKEAVKKTPAKGKTGKSSGMISFDDSDDEDDVF
ncbi:MAG: TIM barrel protein [Candidatus Thermoplasmatota archaeon]|nr:TIM barrel protein [Candidatus Thalassarchaeaceae archaeon]MEC7365224.1 TIM barrel protein [Candidatus Thermoplasmatota archaeon]MEC7458283.1 TIM barrel protein [Candidatus Thermoplasmatota archaeon]MEC8170909.1 TIM barrel protein [Candidatus Thermoplasmatota archaeon]MEC9136843.1 TIM barrel protein [Candidatus Thermoplasmatota archaeon]